MNKCQPVALLLTDASGGRSTGNLPSRHGLATPISKRSGISRILQNRTQRRRGRIFPQNLSGIQPGRLSPRKLQLVPQEVQHHLTDRTEFPELLKHQVDALPNTFVRIEDHAFGCLHQSGRHMLNQFSTTSLRQATGIQTQTQTVQLRSGHRSL